MPLLEADEDIAKDSITEDRGEELCSHGKLLPGQGLVSPQLQVLEGGFLKAPTLTFAHLLRNRESKSMFSKPCFSLCWAAP